MKLTKKLLAFLLTLTVATTMTPGLVFAADQPIEITDVKVTGFSEPTVEKGPDYELSVPKGVPYHLATNEELNSLGTYIHVDQNHGGVWWFKTNGGLFEGYISPEYQFKDGNQGYSAQIVLIPDEGYVFSEEVTIDVRGKENATLRTRSYGTNCYAITKEFKAVKEEIKVTAIDEKNFPDKNFREYVKRFDLDNNGVLTIDEVKKVNEIDCEFTGQDESKKIESLEGIKYFTSAKRIDCENNKINELDVSGLKALEKVNCVGNGMTNLNISQCTALTNLYCYDNELSNIDLSTNSDLKLLSCRNNNLSNLDLSKNLNIKYVYAEANNIMHIDTEANTNLKKIYYAPKDIKMDVRENFDYTTVPTLDEYIKNAGVKVQTEGLIFNPETETVSLEKGENIGKLILVNDDNDKVKCVHQFYYEEGGNVPEEPDQPEKPDNSDIDSQDNGDVVDKENVVNKTDKTDKIDKVDASDKKGVDKEKAPKTIDENEVGMWMATLLIAGASVAFVLRRKTEKNK